jgi:hypothetical protein
MTNKEKYYGIVAGLSLIVMALAAGFSYGYVQNQWVGETALQTTQKIGENKSIFFAGLAGWLVILITDLLVAYALYVFYKKANKQISEIAAVIRVLYTIVLALAVYRLFSIIPLIDKPDSANNIQAMADAFQNTWSVGLIIFGFHLLLLGYLSIKSKHIPQVLGYLLYFGGAAYLFVHSAKQLNLLESTTIGSIESILSIPMALCELLLAFWLIYKGFRKTAVT